MVGNKTQSRATVAQPWLGWKGGIKPCRETPPPLPSPPVGAARSSVLLCCCPLLPGPAAALRPFAAGPTRRLRNKMADGGGASGPARTPMAMRLSYALQRWSGRQMPFFTTYALRSHGMLCVKGSSVL